MSSKALTWWCGDRYFNHVRDRGFQGIERHPRLAPKSLRQYQQTLRCAALVSSKALTGGLVIDASIMFVIAGSKVSRHTDG
ncbi:MAG: hypothetical protein FJ308_18880 [Planctomycetes bacterium]|nr:hypothetical protein [Planctomycetota bacterium]